MKLRKFAAIALAAAMAVSLIPTAAFAEEVDRSGIMLIF